MQQSENKLYNVACELEQVISKFKNRFDVQNGNAIAWKRRSQIKANFENTPKSIGDGLTTTGWCVSASEALLNDLVFQTFIAYRSAKAKLISIDIKEQFYGECFNGSQNKYHTAILLEIDGFLIVVDITCTQFGNSYTKKDIWDYSTWQETFRSALCKHNNMDFHNNPQLIAPILDNEFSHQHLSLDEVFIKYNLHDITNITESERDFLVDFLHKKLNSFNNNLLIKNINSHDYKYLERINDLLDNLPLKNLEVGYSVLKFKNITSAKNWLSLLLESNTLPCYLKVSKSLQDSCNVNNINKDYVYCDGTNDQDETYIVFELKNLLGIDIDFMRNCDILLPYGTTCNVRKKNISNENTLKNPPVKMNTITITVNMK
jgi:phage anti-repressor protein